MRHVVHMSPTLKHPEAEVGAEVEADRTLFPLKPSGSTGLNIRDNLLEIAAAPLCCSYDS